MKCTICGQDGYSVTVFVNMSTMKSDYVCARCQATDMARSFKDLKELDAFIEECEAMSKRMEEIVKSAPEIPAVPPGLEGIAQTPMTHYKAINITIVELKSRRLELLTQKDSKAMLEYELKKALEAEDYEKSAALRDQLENLKKD